MKTRIVLKAIEQEKQLAKNLEDMILDECRMLKWALDDNNLTEATDITERTQFYAGLRCHLSRLHFRITGPVKPNPPESVTYVISTEKETRGYIQEIDPKKARKILQRLLK